MLKQIFIGLCVLCVVTSSWATNISTSANIDILAVNGKKLESSFLNRKNKPISTSAGQTQQLVVRVSEIIRDGSNHYLFESSPIIVTFQGQAENITLSTPHLRNQNDVKKFQLNPKIIVTTQSGHPVESQQDLLNQSQNGFLPGVNIEENLATYNSSQAKASVKQFVNTAIPVATMIIPNTPQSAVQNKKVSVEGENVSEQMLQYWFQQADPQTRHRFLNWAKQQ